MDWWILGIKAMESGGETLMLLSRKPAPQDHEQCLVVNLDGCRRGRASMNMWVLGGGTLLKVASKSGSPGDDLPDLSGIDPRDLTGSTRHHRC